MKRADVHANNLMFQVCGFALVSGIRPGKTNGYLLCSHVSNKYNHKGGALANSTVLTVRFDKVAPFLRNLIESHFTNIYTVLPPPTLTTNPAKLHKLVHCTVFRFLHGDRLTLYGVILAPALMSSSGFGDIQFC